MGEVNQADKGRVYKIRAGGREGGTGHRLFVSQLTEL